MDLKINKEQIQKGKLIEISHSPKIVIYFDGANYFAFHGICPHAKWPLEMGRVNNHILTCCGHGWEFNIKDGKCLSNPDRNLKFFTIKEDSDQVIISY